MPFPDKLDALMRQKGLSQMALAQELNVSQRAVSGWLTGAVPRPKTASAIADYFGVTVAELLNSSLRQPLSSNDSRPVFTPQTPAPTIDFGDEILSKWRSLPIEDRVAIAERVMLGVSEGFSIVIQRRS